MFFPDKPRAFAETARVLTPGGRFLFTVWDRVEESTLPKALADAVAIVLPDEPPDFITRIPHGYFDANRIAADLSAGGLHLEHLERVSFRAPAAPAEVARAFCLGTPLRFGLQQRGRLDELTAAISAEVARLLGSEPVDGRLTALQVQASR
jgi:SAM-dependent methyltransferase